MTLSRLIDSIREGFRWTVISLTSSGALAERTRDAGATVYALGISRGVPDPAGLLRLAWLLRKERPHVIQSWLYAADLAAGLAGRLGVRAPVVWGVHNTALDPRMLRWSTRLAAALCARTSRCLPTRIVCCAESVRDVHLARGYPADRTIVIQNGFDTTRFRPDGRARQVVRSELNIPPDTHVIGMIARFDPHKDHRTMIAAASALSRSRSDVVYLLCGEGITWENATLARWIDEEGLRSAFRLLGRRDDVHRILASLDVATLTSTSEGLPNVLGEAMSCGVPCVATDVGDVRALLGDTGTVVPSKDAGALSRAWDDRLGRTPDERQALGARARARIEAHYTLAASARSYAALYAALAGIARDG